jgi:hypothetical protein
MNCFMGPYGFLATSCALHFQDHKFSRFQSPKYSVIAFENVLLQLVNCIGCGLFLEACCKLFTNYGINI